MKEKYKILIFFGALLASTIILGKLCLDTKSLILSNDILNTDTINSLQKKITVINIIAYSVLAIISLWVFATSKRLNYLVISLLLFVAVTLFNNVTLTKLIIAAQGKEPASEGTYWLLVFVGIFYILGAVLIAAIGYLVVKNYTKRYIDNDPGNRFSGRKRI